MSGLQAVSEELFYFFLLITFVFTNMTEATPMLIGSIEQYVIGTSFARYFERLEYLFDVNAVENPNRKKALFITLGGPAVYDELKLLYPSQDDLKAASFNDVIKKLRERFDKEDSDLIQRFNFILKPKIPMRRQKTSC